MTFIQSDHAFLVKAATRELVARSGGLQRAGEIVGVSTTQMHRYQSPSHGDFISLKAMIVLQQTCKDPVISRLITQLTDHPELSETTSENAAHILTVISQLMISTAKLQEATGKAVEAGRITTTDIRGLDRLASATETTVSTYRRMLASQLGPNEW